MGKYSLRRSKKRTMFKSSGNNRNHAPVKDRAGHIVNKSGYNEDLIEQKVMRRVAETTEILKDKTIEELQELLNAKGVEVSKKFDDDGKLIDVKPYMRNFSTSDKHAIRQLITFKERKKVEDSKKKDVETVETPKEEEKQV